MDIDLTRAVVVCYGEAAGVEAKAVDVLIEELAFRTGIELSRLFAFPNHSVPVIAIGTIESLSKIMRRAISDIRKGSTTTSTNSYGATRIGTRRRRWPRRSGITQDGL